MTRRPWTAVAGRAHAGSSSVRWFGDFVEVIAKLSDPSAGDSAGDSALGAQRCTRLRPPIDRRVSGIRSRQGARSGRARWWSLRPGRAATHADLDVATQSVGDRAEVCRPPDHLLESGRLESVHLCAGGELDRRYSRRALHLTEGAGGAHRHALGRRLFSSSTRASAIAKQLAWAAAISRGMSGSE
jgi:hypothetical protein